MKPIRETRFRFRRVGGAWQPRIDTAEDLKNLLQLDEAFWAMTGVSVDILRFDARFLGFLDRNAEGRISCDEVKEALRFLIRSFRNLSGVMKGASALRFSDLNEKNEAVSAMIAAARAVLSQLGKADAGEISLDDLSAPQIEKFRARARKSGERVPMEEFPAGCQDTLQMIRRSGRVVAGETGDSLTLPLLDDFFACVRRRLAYQDSLAADPSLLFDGEKTPRSYALYAAVSAAVDNCFLNAAARKFFASDPERTAQKKCLADLWEPEDVRQALERSAAIEADPEGKLDFSAPLNPLFQDALHDFAAADFVRPFLENSRLSAENWKKLKALVAPYGQWLKNAPAGDGLEDFSAETLRTLADGGQEARIRSFLEENLRCDADAKAAEMLFTLLLLQRDFLLFLRNFVTLEDIFDPSDTSRLEAGTLVMDGRHFTLAIPVKNVPDHKKIVKESNICVLYVEISRRHGESDERRTLAVGVTDGTMKNLFIGKRGVFFDAAKECWNAVVTDMLKQPVSLWEALIAPFDRLGELFVQQTEKIFHTRDAEMQKCVDSSVKTAVPPVAPAAKPGALPPAAAATSLTPGLPMLLMGGGIGLAAVGSSVAFIARSLRSVSFWTVLAVLAGFFLLFGLPVFILAMVRLFRRNLSIFLESSGCALNQPMRLSFRMGTIFTFAPRPSIASMLWKDPSDAFAAFRRKGISLKRRILIFILLICLGLLCGFFAAGRLLHFSSEANSPAAETKAGGNDICPKTSSSTTGE